MNRRDESRGGARGDVGVAADGPQLLEREPLEVACVLARALALVVARGRVERLDEPAALTRGAKAQVDRPERAFVGRRALAERLSARDVATIVGRHLEAMAEVVLSHGGTIDKFQGDAVMAIFGAPDPVEDHAERALRCALGMQQRQAELNVLGWGTDVQTLGLGIGVNTMIFSLVSGVILRPLPYKEPNRLVMLWETDRTSGTVRDRSHT